jgi:integrase/recombinase XerD
MAITTKFVLRTNKTLPNGEHPIMLRITEDRKSTFVSTKKYSSVKDWDVSAQTTNKSHPHQKSINALLSNINLKITFYFSNLTEERTPRIEAIKEIVERQTGAIKKTPTVKLLAFFQQEIDRLKSTGRLGYASVFTCTLQNLKKFTSDTDFDFQDIDVNFIRRFEDFLIQRNIAVTTRSIDFRTFRTLWRNAIKEKNCPENHYPFKDFPFSKYNNPKTRKRAITSEQFQAIAKLKLEDDKLVNSRNYFLFSYYCRGLNFTDLASLKWTNIIDGFLNYVRAKTKEEFNFKIHPEALKILEHYQNLEGNSDAGFVFPILYKRHATLSSQRDRKIKILKRVNQDLKIISKEAKIEKNVTTYVARHTYATTLHKNGISIEEIGKSLGHDDTKTTEIYLDEIDDPLFDDRINSTI